MGLIRDLLYTLPGKPRLSPEDLAGLEASQALAYKCAKDIAAEMKEGWTEKRVAGLMDTYLADHGVRTHFHKSFAWFGERTRFDGMTAWAHFLPSDRVLRPGENVILDTAPVVAGFASDIGHPTSLGPNPRLDEGRAFLAGLRETIRELFESSAKGSGLSGADVCEAVVRHIRRAGFDPVHHRYPGAVLGHRLHKVTESWRPPLPIPFSWQAVAGVVTRGIYPELLNEAHQGHLEGVWAIEPHFGGAGYGCKFEEMLIVDGEGARWLSKDIPW